MKIRNKLTKKMIPIVISALLCVIVTSSNSIKQERKNVVYQAGNGVNVVNLKSSSIYTNYKDDFIFPNSSNTVLTKNQLVGLSKEQLGIARNEIYARHGYVFVTEQYKSYFINKSWYYPNPAFKGNDEELNKIEVQNVRLIKSIEENNNYDYNNYDFIFPNSSNTVLTRNELVGLSKEQLGIARNEIYARHGYVFVTEQYKSYFRNKSWYYPNSSFKGNDEELNKIEVQNVRLIKSIESGK